MSHHTIELNERCKECHGSGLYIGLAERDGAAVVCHGCEGAGCHHLTIEYDDFEGRQPPPKAVSHVIEANPGIVVGQGKDDEYTLSDFGGQSYANWAEGKPFPPGSEMRRFTCPAWWYQTANYDLKPDWKECWSAIGLTFSRCPFFAVKERCWERWDKEHPTLAPQPIAVS